MKINVHNQTTYEQAPIERILFDCFRSIDEEKEMQVILVTADEIKRLNSFYRNIDHITDVLSFIDESDDESLGDVFICVEKAKEQAVENNHSFAREIAFLAVHGYLHLTGYDHMTKEDEEKMIKEQKKILKMANLERGKK